jgi:hypothetical protein
MAYFKGMSGYLLVHQPTIIMACCTLHNFIEVHNLNDEIFNGTDPAEPKMDIDQTKISEQPDEYGNNDEAGPSNLGQGNNNDEAGPSNLGHYDFSQAVAVEMGQFRECIAQAMWVTRHGHDNAEN